MSETTATPPAHPIEFDDAKRRIKAIFIGSVGNLVEWYDFYAYTAFALYFAPHFFPSTDPVVQQLNAATLFAAGFIVRPVGGWLFGHLADRYGRRLSLMVSVLMMCFGSLIIAFTPTYETIGFAAPALLALARIIEGLSLGGEYGASATYLTEIADPEHRGFYSSFQYVTLIGGQLTAILVLLLLQNVFLTHEQLVAWGWRVPFVIGALTAVVSLYLRRSLSETSSEASRGDKDAGSIVGILRNHLPAFLTVLGYTAGGSLIFYTFTTYMQKYLVNSAGMPIKTASGVMTFALLAFMCMQPAFGALADRIGRRSNMLLFGGLGALATVPIMTALGHVQSPYAAFGLILIALMIVSFYTSISGIVKAEMFPPEVRALGVGLAYAIANAAFGGSAEYVALWLKAMGDESAFFWYVSAMMVVAFMVALRLPKQPKYLHHDH